MTINALQAAKYLCMMSNWTLTNLELQRMLYISNMLYLGKYNKPLVKGSFQARIYGPVHVQLYERVRQYGLSPNS